VQRNCAGRRDIVSQHAGIFNIMKEAYLSIFYLIGSGGKSGALVS